MADRWNHHTVVVDNAKPVRVFMPGKRVGNADLTPYRCPVHGIWIAYGPAMDSRPCTEVVGGARFCCELSPREPDVAVEPGPVAEHPAGFKVRVRGAGGTVTHAYRCPVHGLFDARVERANVPDEMPCPREGEDSNFPFPFEHDLDADDPPYCGLTSPWAGSFCGQGIAAGEVTT